LTIIAEGTDAREVVNTMEAMLQSASSDIDMVSGFSHYDAASQAADLEAKCAGFQGSAPFFRQN
jgi:hypothetical protein